MAKGQVSRAGLEHEARVLRQSSKNKSVPWPVFALGRRIISLASYVPDCLLPSSQRCLDQVFNGFALAEAVRTLTALRVPDALAAHGPLTAAELAQELGLQEPDRLRRLLLFALENNFFSLDPSSKRKGQEPRFRNSRLSACLREDHPLSQRDSIFVLVSRQHIAGGWPHLEEGIRSGGIPFVMAYGKPVFERLAAEPALEEVFSGGMTATNALCGDSILADFKWREFKRFIDVGGAYGSFLADLMRRCPKATGVLFDQPQVIERAMGVWADGPNKDLLQRVTFAPGSFFDPETLPPARPADAFILRQILHDWDDATCVEILTTLRQAFGKGAAGAKLLLVEAMPPSPVTAFHQLRHDPIRRTRRGSDIHMMSAFGEAKEREEEEMRALLAQAGFHLDRVVQTRSLFAVAIASPVPLGSKAGPDSTENGATPTASHTGWAAAAAKPKVA